MRTVVILLLLLLACGCARPADVAQATETAAASVQQAAVAVAVPAALDVQAHVESTVSPVQDTVTAAAQATTPADAPPQPEAAPAPASIPAAAVALLVRHEIVSPAFYTARLQGFACPGPRSGPTAGIGSDLGVHTPARIRADWSIHPQVERMTTASGRVGFAPCRSWRGDHADIRTPYPLAREVFATRILPAYVDLAARTFRNGWDTLPPNAQGALVVTVYVRGASMRDAPGSQKREEMRRLRDVCVPAGDVQCIATAHRAMCARFEGRADAAGLCRRFRDTADLAVQA